MLSRIEASDFLSYKDVAVDFEGADSIAVCGDNGSGKSSLLEILPYAYYGIGRYQYASELVRLTADDQMHVHVVLKDVPSSGHVMEILRGTKPKGWVQVRVDKELVAKGREANEYIENTLGMSAEIFLLTAFFGLGDNKKSDPLLKVEPATCLETLQKIAKVHVYTKFYKKSSERQKRNTSELEKIRVRVDTLSEIIKNPDELKKELDEIKAESVALRGELQKNQISRDALVVQEDKYIAFVRERDKVESDIVSTKISINSAVEYSADERETVKVAKGDAAKCLPKLKDIKAEISAFSKKEKAIELRNITTRIGNTTLMRDLKKVASGMEDKAECPLCNADITEKTMQQWRRDVKVLGRTLEELIDKQTDTSNLIFEYDDRKADIANLESALATADSRLRRSTDRINKYKKDVAIGKAQLEKLQMRHAQLEEKLGSEYDKVVEDLSGISEIIEDLQRQVGNAESTVRELRKGVEENKDLCRQLREAKKKQKARITDGEALGLLMDAFSRYGIPLTLLDGLREDITKRATEIYEEFGPGEILIQDVEGAKPGVRFSLSDKKGIRPFAGLSLGERVMFFIAVRVAVAQIIEATTDINIDFLVLDEGMGNLSPEKRTDLTRLINKILRRIFPKVIMVSHTEMPEIFSRTLWVTDDDGISRVEVR